MQARDSVGRYKKLPKVTYKGSFPKGVGFLKASLTVAGEVRKIDFYAPSGLSGNRPLLITFHGTNGDAMRMIRGPTKANILADREKLLVVSPRARKMRTGDWDNHGGSERYWATHPNTDPKKNVDLLLVQAIIQEAYAAYKIDRRRVYVMGHSNGGFFAILCATTLPNQIAAFVENASGLVQCKSTGSCKFQGTGKSCSALAKQKGYCSCRGAEKPGPIPTRGRKVPGYISHSTNDNVVSVYYSCELAKKMTARGYTLSINIRQIGKHSLPNGMALMAWPFLKKHKLP